MKFKLLIFILLTSFITNILMSIKVSAEPLKKEQFENLSIDDGLSNEYVTTIMQDSKGYMWIGTVDGLNRYDGERVKIYNSSNKNKNALSSPYINDVEEDFYGNIWIATDYGLDFLIRDTDTIVRMKDVPIDKYNLGRLKITSLLKSKYEENIMWVGTENGLMKINIKNNSIKYFYNDKDDINSLTSSFITCLEEVEDGSIFIGTNYGVNFIDKDYRIIRKEIKEGDGRLSIYNIEKDNLGNLIISAKEGIFVYDIGNLGKVAEGTTDNNSKKKYEVKEKNFKSFYTEEIKESGILNNNSFIMVDSKNNVWVSSSNGILKYSRSKNELDILRKDTKIPNSLSSNVITCFYEDFNGTIWIGTEKGVNILNNNKKFGYHKEVWDIQDKNVVSIMVHNKYLWIATKFHGVYIYDIKTSHLIKHIYNKDIIAISNNEYINSLVKINDECILIVTNKGLVAIDIKEGTCDYHLTDGGHSPELNYIYSDEKLVWIATTSNFYSYNINTNEVIYYNEELIKSNINPSNIKYILPDYKDENIIWLGGIDTGIVKYHKEKGVVENYINNYLYDNSLSYSSINSMIFDNIGNLWIGTNIGLGKFDTKEKQFTSYTIADGLTNNFINSILFDDNDNLWISTNKGLNKFDVEKEEFINFTKKDGIYGYQFNSNSGIKLKSGAMIFGSTNGCTYFHPNDVVVQKENKNKVVIGDIFIGENKAVYDGKELVLEYKDRNLSVNYFLPNYESLNSTTYEYILEGVDSDWIFIDSKSELEFKSLNPGKYILKIRARDCNGELSEEAMIKIIVKQPIWKTPLAYFIYIFIIIALIISILSYVRILRNLIDRKTMKLNNQLEENERLSKEIIDKEKFKNSYFVNLSHELRTPINVIASTVQLINKLSQDKSITQEKSNKYMNIISKNCDNLLKIINDIIDSSKIETGNYKINKKNNDIVYIVEETALNMSKFIEEKGLSLIVDPEMEEKIISCDSTEIERCVVNLLANAVKFTSEGGEIRVFIKEIENNIEIIVEDTGIGISKEDQEFIFKRFSQVEGANVTKVSSSGIGLTLVKYVVELHGGYVKLESELNKGSKFTLVLPSTLENNVGNYEDYNIMKL